MSRDFTPPLTKEMLAEHIFENLDLAGHFRNNLHPHPKRKEIIDEVEFAISQAFNQHETVLYQP